MAKITIEFDDGRMIEYSIGDFRLTTKLPTREFTPAEYAALPIDGGFVHRKVIGPRSVSIQANLSDGVIHG